MTKETFERAIGTAIGASIAIIAIKVVRPIIIEKVERKREEEMMRKVDQIFKIKMDEIAKKEKERMKNS